MKDNKRLMEENKQLKQQSTIDKKEIEKIKEMRKTITHLLSRISHLEGFNQGNVLIQSQNLKDNQGLKEGNKKPNPPATNR